jgi:hypothetical protein
MGETGQSAAYAGMPQFQCHKKVGAVKIGMVTLHDPTGSNPPVEFSGGFIFPEGGNRLPIPFDAAFWEKHKPEAGGYYVVYEDGYRSYSPASAFESGYSSIPSHIGGEMVYVPNWQDKIQRALFPSGPYVETPELEGGKDGLCSYVNIDLSFADRIRAFVSGRIQVISKTTTENVIGRCVTIASTTIKPPKFLDRHA